MGGTFQREQVAHFSENGWQVSQEYALPIGENDSEALYRVVEACYETTSLIVTSNFVLASFDEILNPRSIAAALVDRLAHHAHLIETTGESIRLSQALSGKGVMPL